MAKEDIYGRNYKQSTAILFPKHKSGKVNFMVFDKGKAGNLRILSEELMTRIVDIEIWQYSESVNNCNHFLE